MNSSDKRYYAVSESRLFRCFLKIPIVGLFIHWIFQSLLYMDLTERLFKIWLEAILFLGFFALFRSCFSLTITLLLAILVTHTINFICNSHFWVVLKHYGIVQTPLTEIYQRKEEIADRIRAESSVKMAVVYGSFSREEGNEFSDLDIKIVRKPGMWNGLRVCWFTVCERARAFFDCFPLDIYVLDSEKRLHNLRADEILEDLL